MMIDKKHIFFLGGHDAEMNEIRNILSIHELSFYDKNLIWSDAKASKYKEDLNTIKETEIPVLIELTIDTPIPSNAIIIDHHNKDEKKKSSIEQTAELLKLKLNRRQQLIAANDRGYIPAMECMCATKNEIKETREYDRRAQGVTEEDEKLAEESIKEKTIENRITIIKSKTDKFSAITDRLYGVTDRLLIYTKDELTFYGIGKNKLVEKYESKVKEKKAFHGGGDFGFFGFGKDSFSENEIETLKNEIVNMELASDKPISHHIFLFPFKWDIKCKDTIASTTLKDRINLNTISQIFKDQQNFIQGVSWRKYNFTIQRPRDYNEYIYFYEYVTATLFGNNIEETVDNFNGEVIQQYNLNLEKNKSKYHINVVERNPWGKPKIDEITYELNIEDIVINFYQTGVGILSFHMSNYDYKDPEEILDINDFGRRIYPQFLNDLNPKNPLSSVKESFLANRISLQLKTTGVNEVIEIKEDFRNYCSGFENKNPRTISRLPKFISKILGGKCKDTEVGLQKGEVKLTPVIDDRMFTICWYGNDQCSSLFMKKQWSNQLNRLEYKYETNELWNRFIFVDNRSSGLANDNLLREFNIKHTYDRWIDRGNIFGISRYSFILLTNREYFPKYILLTHLQTVYFQLVMLALLQRASLIRFSNEATKVKFIEEGKKGKELKNKLEYVEQLYERYLHFVNKMFFREPTAQEQGIELYDMLLEKMRIEREVKDLDRELDEIHKYVTLIAQNKENEEIKILSKLATWFLPATLVAGILGMNTLPESSKIPKYLLDGGFYWPLALSLILMGSFTLIIYLIFKKMRKKI